MIIGDAAASDTIIPHDYIAVRGDTGKPGHDNEGCKRHERRPVSPPPAADAPAGPGGERVCRRDLRDRLAARLVAMMRRSQDGSR